MHYYYRTNPCRLTDERVLIIFGKRIRLRLSSLGITIYTLFIITQPWLARFEEIRAGLHIAIVLFALLFLSVKIIDNYSLLLNNSKIDLFWFLAYAVLVSHIIIIGIADNAFDLFFYTTGVFFLFLAKASIENYLTSINLLKMAGIIYASGSIAQYLFTDSFNRVIFNFTSISSQLRINQMVNGNYFPGFGFDTPAIAASYMVIGIGIVWAFWDSKNRNDKIKDILLVFIMFMGILMTGKRSIFLWTVATLFITYFVLGTAKTYRRRILNISIVLISVVLIFFVLMQTFESVPFVSRFTLLYRELLTNETTGSAALRLLHYQDSWKLFLENPLLGVGWRQFIVLTTGFYPRGYSVHNVYLQLLCEMGILGFSVIMLALIYSYSKTYQILKSVLAQPQIHDPLWKAGLTFSFYFQTFFLLYCLTENPLYNIIYVLLYFLVVSVLNSFILINRTA